MTNPDQFYTNSINTFSEQLRQLKKQLYFSSGLRLIVFCLICTAIYITWGQGKWVAFSFIIGVAVFLFLVKRHQKLQYQRDLKQALIARNELEQKVLKRDFHDLEDGTEFKNPAHNFSHDIDLFGKGSFFQYINRTALPNGTQLLAQKITENNTTEIKQKQEAVKELAKLASWRHYFGALASLVKVERTTDQVVSWLKEYTAFVPKKMKSIAVIFGIISMVLWLGYGFSLWSGYIVFGWFLLGLLITGRYIKPTTDLSVQGGKVQSTFYQYSKLLLAIETQEMQTAHLVDKRNDILTSSGAKASAILAQFAKYLDALDQRQNVLISIPLNGFFLRDLFIANKIEKWIATHHNNVKQWFESIVYFDAMNSLGNFAFNHQAYAYPELVSDTTLLKSTAATHPLLDPKKAIPSDITINTAQFFIVTGANMAGKSTFLRNVALQIVMANIGLPLSATSVKYNPIKLITSMRTTDSLVDDESYFFSELKRLKYIVDAIKKDQYFIILDEILKGTNSTDKAIGSRKFVEKLVASHSTGIIATHDLSLTEAADEMDEVENYFFDARIVNDELYFDYVFKKGVCQNMNASFLLKKMEIVD